MNRQDSALLFCINAVALYIFLQRFNCVRSVRIRSYSGPYFTAFGLNTERHEVSLRIQSESGKIRTRTTPNTDNFYAVFIGSRFIDCIFLHINIAFLKNMTMITVRSCNKIFLKKVVSSFVLYILISPFHRKIVIIRELLEPQFYSHYFYFLLRLYENFKPYR